MISYLYKKWPAEADRPDKCNHFSCLHQNTVFHLKQKKDRLGPVLSLWEKKDYSLQSFT